MQVENRSPVAISGERGEPLPPHDIDAEEAALGSLLIDGEAIFKVALIVRPDDFYRERHNWLYDACLTLYDRSEPINQISVAHELAQRDRLEAAGGAAYLSHLVSIVPTSVYVEHYARIVYRTSMLRRLIDAGRRIQAMGYEGESDVDAVLDRAEGILFRLRHGQSSRDFVHIREILDHYLELVGPEPAPGDGRVASVNIGLADLDRLLGGLHRSDMIILAARPSLGKTSLALNIARNAAIDQKAKVAIFSLEMGGEQLGNRLLSAEAGVDTQRLRLGQHDKAEEERVMEAIGGLSEAAIYVDDSALLRPMEVRSKARRLHGEVGLDLVILDYMQLMQGNRRFENRVQETSEISRSLKALARELDVPVLVVSQLSRAVEARTPHIPMLSDLRDSGSIEQDADVVIFIYRDDVYFTKEQWERQNPLQPYPKGIAQLIVAKHRNGPTGQVSARFFERTARFGSLEAHREGP